MCSPWSNAALNSVAVVSSVLSEPPKLKANGAGAWEASAGAAVTVPALAASSSTARASSSPKLNENGALAWPAPVVEEGACGSPA